MRLGLAHVRGAPLAISLKRLLRICGMLLLALPRGLLCLDVHGVDFIRGIAVLIVRHPSPLLEHVSVPVSVPPQGWYGSISHDLFPCRDNAVRTSRRERAAWVWRWSGEGRAAERRKLALALVRL